MYKFNRLIFATAIALASDVGLAQNNDDYTLSSNDRVIDSNVEQNSVEQISQAELEQILAPIALYPDTILSHILIAATYPLEVIQAERWTSANPELSGADAVKAVADMGWDPSIQALVAFPQILKRMSQDLNWTQTLGEAFLQDEEQVLASVQNLRQLASEAGNLDDTENLNVVRENQTIVIEPVEREVVYVPYYDTRTIYGSWRWAHHAPIYWDYPYSNSYYASDYRRPFLWGPRVSVSFGFFFNTLHWRDRHLVRIPRQYYRPYQFQSRRQIIRHDRARRWAHNTKHRRGVSYRNQRLRQHYLAGRSGQRYNNQRIRPRNYNRHVDGSKLRQRRNEQAQREQRRRNDAPTKNSPRVVTDRYRTKPEPRLNRDQWRRANNINNRQQTTSAYQSRPTKTSSGKKPIVKGDQWQRANNPNRRQQTTSVYQSRPTKTRPSKTPIVKGNQRQRVNNTNRRQQTSTAYQSRPEKTRPARTPARTEKSRSKPSRVDAYRAQNTRQQPKQRSSKSNKQNRQAAAAYKQKSNSSSNSTKSRSTANGNRHRN